MSAPAKPHGRIRIGVGGWTYEPWRGVFYPEGLTQKRELEYAGAHLTSIEVNGTYYGSQKPESFARWREETPENFVFAVKGPRFATNRRVLSEAGPTIERFFSTGVTELKEKLGPINWQFATTKKFDAEDFGAFLALLPKSIGGLAIRHAVEVRNASFRTPEFVALARAHGVAVIIAGDSDYPQIADVTAPFVYARIMGTSEQEALGYAPRGARPLGQPCESVGRGRRAGRPRNRRAAAGAARARRLPLRHQRFQGAQPGRRDGADRAHRLSGLARCYCAAI